MNLLIDIGNTVIKAALADGSTLGKTWRYQGENWCEFLLSVIRENMPDRVLLCSAVKIDGAFLDRMEKSGSEILVMDPSHLDICRAYGIPEFITSDSAASIVAAREMFKGKGCGIFDLGTMIKYTFLEPDGSYSGGSISPGCTTRFRSVSRYAKNLPLLSEDGHSDLTALSLDDSIRCGVVSGIVFELEGYMRAYPDDVFIFTGGDAIYFAKRTKNSIFVVCNLVLMGLALIADRYGR